MSKSQSKPALDGRHQRGERSRQSMVDAALDMLAEGNFAPTAQEIADRAGVGIRTLFRQFEGMDDLYGVIDEQQRSYYAAKFTTGNREGSLDERILHAVEQHAKAYEELEKTLLFARVQMWRSKVLRKNYERANRNLRKDLDDWLPELSALSTSRRSAVDAVASFEMWNRLRELQKLDIADSIKIVYDLLKGLIVES